MNNENMTHEDTSKDKTELIKQKAIKNPKKFLVILGFIVLAIVIAIFILSGMVNKDRQKTKIYEEGASEETIIPESENNIVL